MSNRKPIQVKVANRIITVDNFIYKERKQNSTQQRL